MKSKKIVQAIDDLNYEIIFNNVSYIYNLKTVYEVYALKEIFLKIKPKIITAIIGSTGSGKSTLIQHMNGLLIPSKGEIVINNFKILASKKKIKDIKRLRKAIGVVFQFPENQLFEDTVQKDIMFGSLNMGVSKNEALKKAKKYLSLVQMDLKYLNSSPFNLSGGQKRRVAIAGILALEGNTIILDEPTAGLDPDGEKSFLKMFKTFNVENNKRIIFISHNMDHVLEIADDVIVMDKGKIKFHASPFEIFQNKKLINDLNLKQPKIYRFINKLKEKGFCFGDQKIKNINQLCNYLKNNINTKK